MRNAKKRTDKIRAENTFENICREWWDKAKGNWSDGHAERVINSLEVDIFPQFGDKPVIDIEACEVLDAISKIEARGALNVAERLLQRCSKVFRYAIQTGRAPLPTIAPRTV